MQSPVHVDRHTVASSVNKSVAMPAHYLVVLYYPHYLPRIAKVTKAMVNAQPACSLHLVANNPKLDDRSLKQHFADLGVAPHVMHHDNVGTEFGAYQSGLDDLYEEAGDDLPCLFANDTVGTHYPINRFYLREFGRLVQSSSGSNSIVGHIDSSARRFQLCDQYTSRWIRTNLFVIDREALERLHYEIYVPRLDACINESPIEDEFFSDSIGPSLRAHISHWLFSGSPDAWYKSEPLSPDNYRQMAAKARSILQELFLTMRLEAADTAIVQPLLTKVEKALVNLGCAAL